MRRFADEASFRAAADVEGFSDPYSWSNAPGDTYAAHDHGYAKLLMCAAGAITFHVGPEGAPVPLRSGEGFLLPPRTRHSAVVGVEGCTCLEAHRAG